MRGTAARIIRAPGALRRAGRAGVGAKTSSPGTGSRIADVSPPPPNLPRKRGEVFCALPPQAEGGAVVSLPPPDERDVPSLPIRLPGAFHQPLEHGSRSPRESGTPVRRNPSQIGKSVGETTPRMPVAKS